MKPLECLLIYLLIYWALDLKTSKKIELLINYKFEY